MPSKMSRYARARSASIPPSSPALRSSLAHAVTAGPRPAPARAAVPARPAPRSPTPRPTAPPGSCPPHARGASWPCPAPLHDRAGDRGAQPGRGQLPGPAQHHRLGGPGLGRVQQHRGLGDDHRLAAAQDPGPERRLVPGRLIASSWASDTMSPAAVRVSPRRRPAPGRRTHPMPRAAPPGPRGGAGQRDRAGAVPTRRACGCNEAWTGSRRRSPRSARHRTRPGTGHPPRPPPPRTGPASGTRARYPAASRREPRRPAGVHPREALRRSGHPRPPPPSRRCGVRRQRRVRPSRAATRPPAPDPR